MLTAGLTGGLGCGKTFVARELARLGCVVIQADQLGHQVLAPGGEAYRPVSDHFGRAILQPDGAIDRAALANIVFRDPNELAQLNAIVHPAVHRREQELIAEAIQRDPDAVIIIEAAILVETGFYRRFHRLIVVACSEAQQIDRALARDPAATTEQIRARLARQMPLEEKRRFADFVIDASGAEDGTIRQTREVYAALRDLAAHVDPPQQNPAKMEQA